jgi:putative transposase
VDKEEQVSVRRQCELLKICRSMVYYLPKGEPAENLRLMREIDELHLEDPSAGARRMRSYLERRGFGRIARSRVSRLMRLMGIDAVYPRRRTTIPGGRSGIYPYLLRGVEIARPNQVWCADITYIPMAKGFMYLFAVMDWHSRKVLAWELSNTLDTDFCLRTLNKAVAVTGTVPEIFNTDQGCQFTSADWSERLKELGIKISMDGKGRWIDNVVIERFWRSIKYEDIYLRSYENAWELERGIETYIMRYNLERPHRALKEATPEEVYGGAVKLAA